MADQQLRVSVLTAAPRCSVSERPVNTGIAALESSPAKVGGLDWRHNTQKGGHMAEQTAREKFKARMAATARSKTTTPEPAVEKKVLVVGEAKDRVIPILTGTKKELPRVIGEPIPEGQPQFKVVLFPDERLLTVCKPVEEFSSEIIELAQFMEEFLRNPPLGVLPPIGLAAPQFGECIRLVSCMLNPLADKDSDRQIVSFTNPELIYQKYLRRVTETCLSLPGETYHFKRGKIVKIRATLFDGTVRTFKGHNLVAQMFMHELNHLDGILINTLGK